MSDKRHSATQNPTMRAAIATGAVTVMKDNGKPRKLGIPFADPRVVGETVPPFLQGARPADLTPMQVQMHTIEWRLKSMVWQEMSRQNRLLLSDGNQVQTQPKPPVLSFEQGTRLIKAKREEWLDRATEQMRQQAAALVEMFDPHGKASPIGWDADKRVWWNIETRPEAMEVKAA